MLCGTSALFVLAVLAAPPAATTKVALTADPAVVLVNEAPTPIDKLTEAIKAADKPVTTIALADGGALPARTVMIAVDRCLKGGKPLRATWLQTKGQYTFQRTALEPADWLTDAPEVAEISAGTLPPEFAVTGAGPLLEIDLRGLAALKGTGKERALRSSPTSLFEGTVPGEPGPGAAVALAVGAEPTGTELYQCFRLCQEKGVGRVLLLAKNGADPAGLLVSLAPESDRPGALTRRAKPPTERGAPAYRAMRLLCEEALLALRTAQRADGTLPGDEDFTDAEASALGLMAFLTAGVRAGDGSKNGECVLALTRWLSNWPYDKSRHPRRERTIVEAAILDAAARTRHPLLMQPATHAVEGITKELLTDSQIREGIDKGFEAIGLAAAKQLDLAGRSDAETKLHSLLDATVDADGKVLNNWSTRSSLEALAFAYGFVAFGWAAPESPRVAGLASRAPPEFPATDSPLPQAERAVGIYFQSRVALLAGGKTWDTFDLGIKAALPKTAPKDDLDFEKRTPEQVNCPWSGGHALSSAARVALMTMAYSSPEERALRKKG